MIKNVTANHIRIGGRRVHYMDYIRSMAHTLPQFEGENHKAVMKRIYKAKGRRGLLKYIKRQYLIMRSITRTQNGAQWKRRLWRFFYEVNCGINYD